MIEDVFSIEGVSNRGFGARSRAIKANRGHIIDDSGGPSLGVNKVMS